MEKIARTSSLQTFLTATEAAVSANVASNPAVSAFSRKIFNALSSEPGEPLDETPQTREACHHLAPALTEAAAHSAEMAAVANAFSALSPRLHWYKRHGADHAPDPNFAENHANAIVIGNGGLEYRDDVRIGVSLVAPNVNYPEHTHPPEEIYLAMTSGKWLNVHHGWHEPGAGNVVHNPPGQKHAMQAGTKPLFTIWCLWIADA